MEILLFQNKIPFTLSPDTYTTFTPSPSLQMRSLNYIFFSSLFVLIPYSVLSLQTAKARATLSFSLIFLHLLFFFLKGKTTQTKSSQSSLAQSSEYARISEFRLSVETPQHSHPEFAWCVLNKQICINSPACNSIQQVKTRFCSLV